MNSDDSDDHAAGREVPKPACPACGGQLVEILRQEKNIAWALLRRKIRLHGPLKLLLDFGKCFPQ